MHLTTNGRTVRPLLVTAFAICVALGPALAVQAAHRRAGPLYLTSFTLNAATKVRNFDPYNTGSQLDFTKGAIYEPLFVVTTAGGGHEYPWLATSYKWSPDKKTLTFTTRSGVRWSDGIPFTAKDVAFTFNYGKTIPAADQTGMWASGQLASVNALDDSHVALRFKTVNTTVLQQVAGNIFIVPQHIWANVKDPASFTNLAPVGSGPFTQIVEFTPQEFILGKNPYYWQTLSYDGIKVPALSSNDAALAAMIRGDVDWTGNFVPKAQQAYVQHDPAHFHYFYAANNPPLILYFDTHKYPYSLLAFRKAISYALNRNQVSRIGENGYEPASDAVGIELAWPTWIDAKLKAQEQDLATYNPAKARQMLSAAGFTWKNGALTDPKGNPVTVEFNAPADWSDWVLSFQIMVDNLKSIGIDASFKGVTDNTFFAKRGPGQLNFCYGTGNSGETPYNYFLSFMSKESYYPQGVDVIARGSWDVERWYSDQATTLLQQFRQTTDTAQQHAIVNKLQKIMVDNVPAIPVLHFAWWYTYSTLHFTGFPTAANSYAIGSTYQYPDNVKVLTSLRPAM